MTRIETKYKTSVSFEEYKEYLIKNIFKILPLKEEDKDWRKYLAGLLIEIGGMDSMTQDLSLITLMSRLEGLRTLEADHSLFRKTIFDCIDMVKKIEKK